MKKHPRKEATALENDTFRKKIQMRRVLKSLVGLQRLYMDSGNTGILDVNSAHLLWALMKNSDEASYFLVKKGVSEDILKKYIKAPSEPPGILGAVIQTAKQTVTGYCSDRVFSFCLIHGITQATDECIARKVIKDSGINLPFLQEEVKEKIDFYLTREKKIRTGKKEIIVPICEEVLVVEKYSRDLTAMAHLGELDPLIGRGRELQRAEVILDRKQKNNPVFIGEAGVGKTAIVEGLADKLYQEKSGLRVLSLDLARLVGNTKYRGEFEERLTVIIEELKENPQIIIFIDEIHLVAGAGAAEGSIDASSIFKPALARGEIRCIGATTTDEYQKHIEKDSALERRFVPIEVAEPDRHQTLNILAGLKDRYEGFHDVHITREAIGAAVDLSQKHLPNRRWPDRAIDLIDEAASWAKRNKSTTVQEEHVQEVLSLQTGLSLSQLSLSGKNTEQLERVLKKSVIGQDQVISQISKVITRARNGSWDNQRPLGSFLFIGPRGTGKTELAKTMSVALTEKEEGLVKIDLSKYTDQTAVDRLRGLPAGYVGHEEGGVLTKRMWRKPHSVVLFEGIEKAHPDVFDLLEEILETGHLENSRGKSIPFANCYLVFTGTWSSKKTLGFKQHKETVEINDYLEETFPSKFVGLVDETVVFQKLSQKDILCLIDRQILEVSKLFKNSITVRDPVKRLILDKCQYQEFGAHRVSNVVKRYVLYPIQDQASLVDSYQKIEVDLDGEEILVQAH